jgi:hypothetical protein
MEDRGFGLTDSKPVTIFLDELSSIPFPDPVPQIIPEHSPDDRRCDRSYDMSLSPESTHEDHDIHPRDCCPDDRKGLDTSWKKCNEIIPIPESRDKPSDPLYTNLDPFRSCEWNNDEDKCKQSKKNREKFREGFYDIFEGLFHLFRIWKKESFAKEIDGIDEKNIDKFKLKVLFIVIVY